MRSQVQILLSRPTKELEVKIRTRYRVNLVKNQVLSWTHLLSPLLATGLTILCYLNVDNWRNDVGPAMLAVGASAATFVNLVFVIHSFSQSKNYPWVLTKFKELSIKQIEDAPSKIKAKNFLKEVQENDRREKAAQRKKRLLRLEEQLTQMETEEGRLSSPAGGELSKCASIIQR